MTGKIHLLPVDYVLRNKKRKYNVIIDMFLRIQDFYRLVIRRTMMKWRKKLNITFFSNIKRMMENNCIFLPIGRSKKEDANENVERKLHHIKKD